MSWEVLGTILFIVATHICAFGLGETCGWQKAERWYWSEKFKKEKDADEKDCSK